MYGVIQAGLAFYHVYEAWERKDLLKYGTAVDFLYKTVPPQMLYEGFIHRGKRIFVDKETVGHPLRIVDIQ